MKIERMRIYFFSDVFLCRRRPRILRSLVAEHLLSNIYPAAHYCITLETCYGKTKVYKNGERHTLDCYL